MSGIKALVFDFDGTLADSMMMVLPVYNRVAQGLNLPVIDASDIPRLRRMGPKKLLEHYAIPLWKVPMILHQVRAEFERTGLVPKAFAGVDTVLQAPELRRFRRLILSSNSRSNIERFLREHQIDGFERIECGSSLFGKGRRLRRLLQVTGLSPVEVAYVGDELRDVEAAKEVGTTSIAVSWGYAAREELAAEAPSYLLDEPRELVSVAAQLAAG